MLETYAFLNCLIFIKMRKNKWNEFEACKNILFSLNLFFLVSFYILFFIFYFLFFFSIFFPLIFQEIKHSLNVTNLNNRYQWCVSLEKNTIIKIYDKWFLTKFKFFLLCLKIVIVSSYKLNCARALLKSKKRHWSLLLIFKWMGALYIIFSQH